MGQHTYNTPTDPSAKPKAFLGVLAFWCWLFVLLPVSALAAPAPSKPSSTPVPAKDEEVQMVVESAPPAPPTGLSVLSLKEGVYLSWDPAPLSAGSIAYNVYRSQVPGGGYRLVSPGAQGSPYFLDGPKTSLDSPLNGENYFYVVAAVSPKGEISPYSDEIAITPQGLESGLAAKTPTPEPTPEPEREIVIPERNIINLQLPADSQLSIQGYKKILAQLSWQTYPNLEENNLAGWRKKTTASTNIQQELVVNLKGKVGKNVDVNVDYSDVNRPGGFSESKQNISIVYHGDPNSAVEEVTFGDLQLYLPNTEFAGFSKQLFGLQGKIKLDRFRLTSFFAQTKGVAETKVFKGNYVQVDRTFSDIEYMRQRYYQVTKGVGAVTQGNLVLNNKLPLPNSEQIWVEMNDGRQVPPDPSQQNYRGNFERFRPGPDYTLDNTTGVITFVRGIPIGARIAVAYLTRETPAVPVGFEAGDPSRIELGAGLLVPADGVITDATHLIKDNPANLGSYPPGQEDLAILSPLYLVNHFSLGTDKIVPPSQDPDFRFEVIDQGTNNILQAQQAAVTFQRGLAVPANPDPSRPWHYELNQDLNLLIVDDLSNAGFPERPFGGADGGLGPNGVYSQSPTNPPQSKYRIHLAYKTKLDFFRLDQFNIIRGSESVFLDGRRLRRDQDYTIDYLSGFLDFPDKSLLRPDSQVVVSYEYAPFGTFGQNSILGARAEVDLDEKLFLGSSFLYNSSSKPPETPQLGSTPNSLMLLDADAKIEFKGEDLKAVTGLIPGLERWTPPLALKVSGEVAQSRFSTNTFEAEGEKGVAMVDNMEGTDNSVGPNMSAYNWLVSSAPRKVDLIGGVVHSEASGPDNNRVRFDNGAGRVFQTATSILSAFPGTGGHAFQATGSQTDVRSVLVVPYSRLTDQRWGGVRQVISSTGTDISPSRYFEAWIYNDSAAKPKWVVFDFGTFSEDSNGNGLLEADLDITLRQLSVPGNYHPSWGLPTFYFEGNPWSGSATVGFEGTGEQNSQEGRNTAQQPRTEDMNGDALYNAAVTTGGVTVINTTGLQAYPASSEGYFEYGVRVDWPTGWRLVKIPVDFSVNEVSGVTPDSAAVSFFFRKQGNPSPLFVRSTRMWVTGASPTEVNGYFLVESAAFTRNLWQLQVDPDANVSQGVTVNTSLFDITSVSREQDSRYLGSARFLQNSSGQPVTQSVLNREKSLKITYNLSAVDLDPPNDLAGDPVYYATRNYGSGLDLSEYEELRFDLQARNSNPGETLFIRVGNDQRNYYQYNVTLPGTPRSSWDTVTIPLDGSAGNRRQVGTPFLNRSTLITLGVVSLNPVPGPTGELWINNLRLTSPSERVGLARRANAALVFGEQFATLNARYREVDSGFAQIDQTSSRFQHSKQMGADLSSNSIFLFSQPLSTQFSLSRNETSTEQALRDNPHFFTLPNLVLESALGSVSYNKDFGESFGRLTSLRVSGSSEKQMETFQPAYLASQPVLQGDSTKTRESFTTSSTYDAPTRLWILPIGTNQFNQSFTLARDTQKFRNQSLIPFERITRTQVYGWTNNTEILRSLVLTPGYTLSLVDAKGNTSTPGTPGGFPDYSPFQQRYQPRFGAVFRGIPGVTPSADYSGSNQYDYATYPDGTRYTNANNLTLSLQLNPGTWHPLLQQIGLTLFGSRTLGASSSVPGYGTPRALGFEEKWLFDPAFDLALTASKTLSHQVNGTFKLFDVLQFQPSGSWSDQYTLLSRGTKEVQQVGRTLSLTTNYSRRFLSVPWIDFNLNSVQLNYTRTDNTQYDSSPIPQVDSSANNESFILTLPYDIAEKAQGNIRLQKTLGHQVARTVMTDQETNTASVEYNQRFAPNLEIHLPFGNTKIKLQDAIEFRATALAEFVDNSSGFVTNNLKTERFRGTLDLNYNALKNLRIGLGLVNEYFFNRTNEESYINDYVLWQLNVSAEARF